MRELAAGHAAVWVLERLGLGLDEAVFEGPPAGGGGSVEPPVLANRVAHEHAHLLSRHQVAERDGVLARFGGVVVDVASVTPDTEPVAPVIAARPPYMAQDARSRVGPCVITPARSLSV